MAILGQHFFKEMKEALGLPDNCIDVTIRVRKDCIVTADCEVELKDAKGKLYTELKRYVVIRADCDD